MNNLQNRIIQSTSFRTNYLLVNNLKKINVSLCSNVYKSTLTSNVQFSNLNNFHLNNTQYDSLLNKNFQILTFKHTYAQTTNGKKFF
ncbi:hypothetical protein BCR36DRAFT_26151 [Piromyces finnis]|uniref:Uncharacterized protein n=1 Tax=Piromyces finnis TaxID=1754191 RepID=A0A1Y1VFC3_9FUNG|nr:hypothetical protein BCR36DRAFT_26151 [Piromyces finnis]|eukprot:ORX53435.1 hypothetical protein BCR36DRAFT_26151 [Piromyces finnis]